MAKLKEKILSGLRARKLRAQEAKFAKDVREYQNYINALSIRITALEVYVDNAIDKGKISSNDLETALNEKAKVVEKGIINAEFSTTAFTGLWHKYHTIWTYICSIPALIAVYFIVVIIGHLYRSEPMSIDNIYVVGATLLIGGIFAFQKYTDKLRNEKLRELNEFYLPSPPAPANSAKSGNVVNTTFNVPPQDD
jgi:hypothetical protein